MKKVGRLRARVADVQLSGVVLDGTLILLLFMFDDFRYAVNRVFFFLSRNPCYSVCENDGL
jgi:hypothetical protein